jgi:hypothetical protein
MGQVGQPGWGATGRCGSPARYAARLVGRYREACSSAVGARTRHLKRSVGLLGCWTAAARQFRDSLRRGTGERPAFSEHRKEQQDLGEPSPISSSENHSLAPCGSTLLYAQDRKEGKQSVTILGSQAALTLCPGGNDLHLDRGRRPGLWHCQRNGEVAAVKQHRNVLRPTSGGLVVTAHHLTELLFLYSCSSGSRPPP